MVTEFQANLSCDSLRCQDIMIIRDIDYARYVVHWLQ